MKNHTEQYLFDDYGLIEINTHEGFADIEEIGYWANSDFWKLGIEIGTTKNFLLKVGESFFNVSVNSSFMDTLKGFTHEKVDKPQPKKRVTYNISFTATQDKFLLLKKAMQDLGIIFEVK